MRKPRLFFEGASEQFKTMHPALKCAIMTQAAHNHQAEYEWIHNRINRKALWVKYRDENRYDNDVYFVNWGRDCDHSEWSSAPRPRNATNLMRLQKEVDQAIEWASDEGPGGEYAISFYQVSFTEAWHRDHGMEAYENGHPYNVETSF